MPRGRVPKPTITPDTIKNFLVKSSQGDCWTWQCLIGHSTPEGYQMYQHKLVHRQVYELLVGKIPDGLELHHTCKNRKCVNPEHLIPTTRKDHPDGGHVIWRNKTHCPHGHEYTSENTRVYRGSRFCKRCDEIHNEGRKLERSLIKLRQITQTKGDIKNHVSQP